MQQLQLGKRLPRLDLRGRLAGCQVGLIGLHVGITQRDARPGLPCLQRLVGEDYEDCHHPEPASNPRPETPTAAEPREGQGRLGAVPGTTSDVRRRCVGATAGIGRR